MGKYRKHMGKIWEKYRNHMGKIWESMGKIWETMGKIWDMEVLMDNLSRKDMENIWNLYWKILEHPLNKLMHGGSYN